MNHTFEPHKPTALRHLEYISGMRYSREVFQVFKDSSRCTVPPHILIGTLDQHWDTLVALNRAGCNIAVTVNQTDFKGRKAENITKVRALFSDDDNNLNKTIAMDPPTFRVISKNGPHKYYVCRNVKLSDFKDAQKAIAKAADTDPKVCDLSRSMRLAGFYHMKDPGNPFFVRIESEFEAELEAELNSGGRK